MDKLKEATMSTSNKNKHLTLEERKIIERGICNGATKTDIARILGKDKSTICKEIREHRFVKTKTIFPKECAKYASCRPGTSCPGPKCCDKYERVVCKRRDTSPGACNGCSLYTRCRYDKIVYDAVKAHDEYRTSLVGTREGVNLSAEEAKHIAEIIQPLLKQGLSPYMIIKNHPELGICEKTLYNYIAGKVFVRTGITDLDLRCKVSRKLPKKLASNYKKREDRRFIINRTHKDFLDYVAETGNDSIVEMDTVYNDGSEGPFMQTFKFLDYGFLFSVYHTSKTAADMVNGVNLLEKLLGLDLFCKYVRILLTDRGGEFSSADQIETATDGSLRTKLFYCDPMASGQKGSLENKHRELRYVCPKEVDLARLGLTSQDKMNRVLSHINSAPVDSLHGKTPWEMLHFFAADLEQRFLSFGLQIIEKDMVLLRPYLLK